MMSRKLFAVVGVAGAVVVMTGVMRGLPPVTPNPPGTFSFAALGDAPYIALHGETLQYRLVLKDLDAHDLSLVLHIGDIFWRPCSDERYRQTRDEFNALRHPVIYTPGDNEWTDCWVETTGGYDPLERLARLRQIFFSAPTQSLGGRRVAVKNQSGTSSGAFSEFVENVRWTHESVLFATVNLPGSSNAREAFSGRTAAHDAASVLRTEAAVAGLRETFVEARIGNASAVVLGFHANPEFEAASGDKYRESYEPFLAALEEEAERYAKPVLVAHGDYHDFVVDHPVVRRTTARRLDNVTRLQVPGSPDIGWVKVTATTGAQTAFTFENRVVPAWKYW